MVEEKLGNHYRLNMALWATVKGLRGGSWNNNQNNARVENRNNNHPNNRNNNIGFRVVALIVLPRALLPEVRPAGLSIRRRGKIG